MARKHVRNLLSAYILDELGHETAGRVRTHLGACERCQQEYERLRIGSKLAQKHAGVQAPEGLWSGIEARLGADHPHISAMRARAGVRQFKTMARFGYAMAVLVAIVSTWWILDRRESPSLEVELSLYLSRIEGSSEASAISLASDALVSFKKSDKLTACKVAGVDHVLDRDPMPKFKLAGQRVRIIDDKSVAQLVYSDRTNYFSVFVAPASIEFSFDKREITRTKVEEISCRQVESPKVGTFWFGAGDFQCVLFSPFEDDVKNAAVIRYFVKAHNLLE